MSVLNTLPAPVVQMGLVEKLVDAEQNQPHVQQLAAQQTMAKTLKRQGEQVPEVSGNEHGRKVHGREEERERGGRQKERQGRGARSARNKDDEQGGAEARHPDEGQQHAAPSSEQPETQPGSGNPWAGNILNIKV